VVPARAVAFAAWALTAVEAFLALSFLSGWLVVVAVPLSAVTLAAFAGVTSVNLRRGRDVPCGCFGNAEEQVSARSLVRLALLAAGLAGYAVAVVSPEATPVSADWLGAHSGSVAAYVLEVATLSVALLVAATWTLSARELLTVVRDPPEREPA
jgi:hypothetical protein